MTCLYITAARGDAPDPMPSSQALPEEEDSEESEVKCCYVKPDQTPPNICRHDIHNFCISFQALTPVRKSKGRRVRKRKRPTQSLTESLLQVNRSSSRSNCKLDVHACLNQIMMFECLFSHQEGSNGKEGSSDKEASTQTQDPPHQTCA